VRPSFAGASREDAGFDQVSTGTSAPTLPVALAPYPNPRRLLARSADPFRGLSSIPSEAPLDRIHKLNEFWSRIPAFRVVAETEHLPTAAERLGVTPPALSRSVKIVEEAVGRPLFHRRGRRIELNEAGRLLLASVRQAMRGIDNTLQSLAGAELAGRVAVSTTGMFTPLAVRVLTDLVALHPHLRPHLTHVSDGDVNRALLRGDLDVALLERPQPDPALEIVPLARCPYSVFCGPGHPLHGAAPGLDEVLAHPFVAPAGGGQTVDGWPPALERTVVMTVVAVDDALRVCREGTLLSVLPDPVVSVAPGGDRLHRLPLDLVPPTTLFAVSRRRTGTPSGQTLAEVVNATVRARLVDAHFPPLG